ncbi:MAG: sugar ABC transporter permease [Candidatus Omnitrophica bacterium]|nr:sugar ABC transporter permease [Candidatus Omnitrophota bacterium]
MKLKQTLENYFFILPALLIFTIFYIIPFIWVFQLSLYDWNYIAASEKIFVGLGNFKEVLFQDTSWWQSMRNGVYITFIALTLQNALAFLLALACDREIRLKRFYRLVFFIPPVLSEIVVGMIWRLIIDDISGANIINRMLSGVGLSGLVQHWLYDPKYALTTVALVHSWKGFGWGFLIFLAGLQTIPRELYEAARVDGANAWDSFKNITMPLMVPVTVLVAILTVLGTMQSFALILGLVGGELGGYTSVPVLRIIASMLGASRFGYACAQGLTFGVVLILISLVQYRVSKKFRYT